LDPARAREAAGHQTAGHEQDERGDGKTDTAERPLDQRRERQRGGGAPGTRHLWQQAGPEPGAEQRQRVPERTALGQLSGLKAQRVRDHAGSPTVATAWAAIPSPRPVKPSPSVVVALMLTRSGSSVAKAATRAIMAERCGPMRGRSQISVTSRCLS